ncbi:MAG: ribonuclease P protein component [Proteobacteria bacterium]|nr:ribonuclease P protein component [Pseudomonadota bacterium]
MPRRLTLPARLRLRRKKDFDAVYARGRRLGDGYFGMTATLNGAGVARLGLAVAVRVAGGAVERNRIRRVIKESFRLHQHALPAVDLVVSARAPARAAPGALLRASLDGLWKKVAAQCATSPRP